ncbi:protein FAM240B-like [Thunnus albacares]|uniref:protein FAM240B-like n=1 Tax=Thunnus albacares TaxID=8236 RepID=UPI001CF6355B|nr:protein FAM240B-like [Thunnus albacares]
MCCQVMNAARIHDKQKLKSFWEQKIIQHGEQMDEEDSRMRSSALARLREEWLVRLDHRNQHQQSFFEERIRRAQKAQQNLRKLDSP